VTNKVCFQSTAGNPCTGFLSCQVKDTVDCFCKPPLDVTGNDGVAAGIVGNNTQTCSSDMKRVCGADRNLDECLPNPAGPAAAAGSACHPWQMGPVDPITGADGNCPRDDDPNTNPISAGLVCIPDALQCQCPPNGSTSNFYANAMPEVFVQRKPFLTTNGRRV